jgi:hypothetical protein
MDGNVTIHKVRLVEIGFQQVQGVDCGKTYSPVEILKFVRMPISIMRYVIWMSKQLYKMKISPRMCI